MKSIETVKQLKSTNVKADQSMLLLHQVPVESIVNFFLVGVWAKKATDQISPFLAHEGWGLHPGRKHK
jgi:hypothetical protein